MRRTLIIMAKAPDMGRVKTRLGRAIGMGRATQIYRRLLRLTLEEARGPGWETVIAVEPRSGLQAWRQLWLRNARLIVQSPGDLGARLRAAIAAAARNGPVVIIGADAPALRRRHITEAFRRLDRADAVFGPAADGGFWLAGLARRKRAPDEFENIRWSTAHALEDVRKSLPKAFTVALLETLHDVDEPEDLAALTPRSRK